MKTAYVFSCLAILYLLTACSSNRCVVVLLPEPDGKTGQVVVSNEGGSQLLNKPGQFTAIESAETAPLPPEIMADSKLRDSFGKALDALPARPLHFVLYFKTDTTDLTDDSRKLLTRVLPAVAERNSKDISIVGHTDRVGERAYNYRLGLERALLVRKILLSLGIDPEFIEATSHGENNPLVATEDDMPEPQNRRVEVVVR